MPRFRVYLDYVPKTPLDMSNRTRKQKQATATKQSKNFRNNRYHSNQRKLDERYRMLHTYFFLQHPHRHSGGAVKDFAVEACSQYARMQSCDDVCMLYASDFEHWNISQFHRLPKWVADKLLHTLISKDVAKRSRLRETASVSQNLKALLRLCAKERRAYLRNRISERI